MTAAGFSSLMTGLMGPDATTEARSTFALSIAELVVSGMRSFDASCLVQVLSLSSMSLAVIEAVESGVEYVEAAAAMHLRPCCHVVVEASS